MEIQPYPLGRQVVRLLAHVWLNPHRVTVGDRWSSQIRLKKIPHTNNNQTFHEAETITEKSCLLGKISSQENRLQHREHSKNLKQDKSGGSTQECLKEEEKKKRPNISLHSSWTEGRRSPNTMIKITSSRTIRKTCRKYWAQVYIGMWSPNSQYTS